MARTKSIHRMVTGDENKDPVALEAANESMATSTDAPRNSSSQGNEKKKRKKESPATAAKADNMQNLSENGRKQVRVGKPAEIVHDPEVQAIKPKSKLIPALDVAVEADAPSENKSVKTSTKNADKDPGTVEGANESVATSTDITRYSSSQGNEKKKRKKESPAASIFEKLSDESLLRKTLTSFTTFICMDSLRTTCRTINRLLLPSQCHAARASEQIVDSALFLVSRSDTPTIPAAHMSSNDEVRHQHAPFKWHVLVDGKWRNAPWNKEKHSHEDSSSTCASSDHVLFRQYSGDLRHSYFLFQIQTGKKIVLPDHDEHVYGAVCNFGDCLVLVGSSKIFMSDQAINRWKRLLDVPNPVDCYAAGIIGRKLCVLGLEHPDEGGGPIGCIQIYDFDAETWEMGPRTPEPLCRVSGVVVKGDFHVVGLKPRRRTGHTVICLRFNLESMAWKSTAPDEDILDRGRLTCHAVSHRGSLFILYENRGTMNFWKKLEKDGKWTKISPEVIPSIPADAVSFIKTVGSAVFTV